MTQLLLGGRVWRTTHEFWERCPILLRDGVIAAIGDEAKGAPADTVTDASGMTVLPGLVDVHTHGRSGYDFNLATAEQMKRMKADYARRGVTSVFATLASASLEEWKTSASAIAESGYEGIHFEGRYLSPLKRGAHAEKLLAPLNASELEEVLRGISIPCHVSAALELDRDGSFTKKAIELGATLGLGHTNATAAEARLAMERGAISFTHLYNCMPPLHHREGGAVAIALIGDAYGELIADGVHVSPEMIALGYRCLGKDKTVLITDSMSATGCADGEYSIAGMPVTVKNGKAVTSEGALAGSTLELWQGVRNLMAFAGVPLSDAIACATINPARMVGIDGMVGSIDVGKRADLLLVNEKNELCEVLYQGRSLTAEKV